MDEVTNFLKIESGCRPGAIAQSLHCKSPSIRRLLHTATLAASQFGDLDACEDILINASKQWTWRKKPSGQLPRRGIDSAVDHLSNPLRGAESGSDPQRSKEGSC